MHTILDFDLSNFQSNLPDVEIMKFIQQTTCLSFLEKPDICAPFISKPIKVRNLKHTTQVLHIPHL